MSGIEGELARLRGRTLVLKECVTISDGELSDGMIEIEFRVCDTGDEVIVEETIAAGSVFRIPKSGEIALVGFVDGDRNEGYVIGWIPRPGASPAPSLEKGIVYVYAPAGEEIRLVTDAGVTVEAPEIKLGGDGAVSFVALATKVDLLWSKLYTVFTGWTPVPADGGAVLKGLWSAAFPTPPASVGSSKTRSE